MINIKKICEKVGDSVGKINCDVSMSDIIQAEAIDRQTQAIERHTTEMNRIASALFAISDAIQNHTNS